jgi:hypothetical protein
MKKFILSIAVLLGAVDASAETYFKKLANEFSYAREKIRTDDIDEVGTKKPLSCVQVFAANEDQEAPAFLRKITLHKDGHGPLLPPKTIVKVVFDNEREPDAHGAVDSIETTISKYKIQSLEKISGASLEVRKRDHLILFSRSVRKGEAPFTYGYCYKPVDSE